jgi:hypothetical protein
VCIFEEYPECGIVLVKGKLFVPAATRFVGYRNMAAQRRFGTLNASEIKRLMDLAIEAGLRMDDVSPSLLRAYGALAAEFGFELWSREQARLEARRSCGRAVNCGATPSFVLRVEGS